jgi:uncharacterized protein (DUF1015 family)
MPQIAPFTALRFDPQRFGGDLSNVIAPPYDVLDQDDKEALLARNDLNIVAVDLPHIPPKTLGPEEAYRAAARTLSAWRADGTLVRDREPALYVYHQTFRHENRSLTRRMFFARARLQPFEEGSILPHERTFGGPKEDRLALMKATECNLSPVFGLYADPDDVVGGALAASTARPADLTGTLDDVRGDVWIVRDPAVTGRVVAALADRRVYIADGHHRYGTALNYRSWLCEERGGITNNHPANFVLLVLGSMDDPGCLILPYHRVLGEIDLASLAEALRPGVEQVDPQRADVVLLEGTTGRTLGLRYTRRDVLRELEPDECAAWYDLDAAYLHRYLIDELVRRAIGREPKVHYVKSRDSAEKTSRAEHGVALLVRATPMVHLRSVSEQGGLMPQKSTYFHPKLATGLVIHPLS